MPFMIIGFLVLGIIQLYAGAVGITYYWGAGWAGVVIFLCLMFRVSLPLTIGSFYCALNVWGWHWLYSLLFAAPGLVFIVPSVFIGIYILNFKIRVFDL